MKVCTQVCNIYSNIVMDSRKATTVIGELGKDKGKGFQYSILSVGPGADPGVQTACR